MSFKYINNAVNISKHLMALIVEEGDSVVDATVGNGNDTLYLAKLVGEHGKVYGFDIQKCAINTTKQKLIDQKMLNRVVLINTGHENINKYIKEKVKVVVFNLGYLPKGDKNIKTSADTTIEAIKKSLQILDKNGMLLIICYTGHEGGLEEKESVFDYLKRLNQKEYNVLKFKFINQINNPPILFGVEKKF